MVITVHLVKPNVSYAVVLWKSRKDYARQTLADWLQKALHFGLWRLLITTHQDNRPSRRVIEATGGVLGGLVPYPSQPGKFRLEFLAIHARAESRAAAAK
jgi:predicted acetyltransferase